jgi:hypothetical protein
MSAISSHDETLVPEHPPTERPARPVFVYREKKVLVMRREEWAGVDGARRATPVYQGLPNRCVRCAASVETGGDGAASVGARVKRNLAWHPPILALLLLAGLLPYALVAMLCTKKAVLFMPLCARHLRRRRIAFAITAVLLVLAVGLLIAAVALESSLLAVAMGLAILASIIWAVPCTRISLVLRPRKIDEQGIRLAGASRAFLDTLPEYSKKQNAMLPPRLAATEDSA